MKSVSPFYEISNGLVKFNLKLSWSPVSSSISQTRSRSSVSTPGIGRICTKACVKFRFSMPFVWIVISDSTRGAVLFESLAFLSSSIRYLSSSRFRSYSKNCASNSGCSSRLFFSLLIFSCKLIKSFKPGGMFNVPENPTPKRPSVYGSILFASSGGGTVKNGVYSSTFPSSPSSTSSTVFIIFCSFFETE